MIDPAKKLFLVWVLWLFFLPGTAFAAGTAVVVVGVSESYITAGSAFELCISAVKTTLQEEKIACELIYSGIDEGVDEETRTKLGKEAAAKARSYNPSVIIALNDYSVQHMALNINDIPIVGAFFFSPPAALGLPKPNVTGVMRGSYASDIWKMAKQLTGAKTVGMLSRNSFSMSGVKTTIMAKAKVLEEQTGVKLVDMYLCDSFDQWENKVKNWSEDLLYIIDTSRLTRNDKMLTAEEVVKWTVENSAVPVIATNEPDTRFGAMFSIVVSEPAWGRQAAEMALKVLSGTPVSNLPMETVKEGNLLINAKTVDKYKIEIPYEILESASHVYE